MLAQNGPGSDGNEGAVRILQSSSITGTYHQIVECHIQDTLWRGYLSAEKQSVYSTAPVDWTKEQKNKLDR